MSRKPERLGVERNETQVYTQLIVYYKSIQQIILVIIGPHGRKRTDKALQEQGNIILKDIYLSKHLLQKLPDALLGKHLVYSRRCLSLHDSSFRFRVFAVENGFDFLFLQHRKNGSSRFQGIDVFIQKMELPSFTILLGLLLIVIQTQQKPFILVVLIKSFVAWIMILASFNDLLHQADGRIVFLAVSLLPGFDNYFLQGYPIRRQLNMQGTALSRMNG